MSKTGWTGYLTAEVAKIKGDVKDILNEAVQDVMEGAQTVQRGITKGATSFEVGKIPEGETGALKNSLHLGEEPLGDNPAVAGLIEPGTIQTFSWQTPYASRIEFGYVGEDSLGRQYEQAGRFFASSNAAKFGEYVEKHAKEVSGK